MGVTVDDVVIAAIVLRGTARSAPETMWTMPAENDCGEWSISLPSGGTVLLLAKHINPRINSSVLFSDMANTLYGGEDANEDTQKKSPLGCGEHGGQMGAIIDTKSPYYSAEDYGKNKNKPEGIILKIVKAT
jgi:hypothetical protein